MEPGTNTAADVSSMALHNSHMSLSILPAMSTLYGKIVCVSGWVKSCV